MAGRHAIRAATVFDGRRFLDGAATLVVEGGTIAGLEPGRPDLPADLPVRDHPGTLLPGLIDTHVHLVADATPGGLERTGEQDVATVDAVVDGMLLREAAAGVTTVRDLGDVAYRTVVARDGARTGRPRVVAAGPPLTVPDGHCHFLGGVVSGPGAVPQVVADHVDHGVDVIKVMASGGMLTPGTDVTGTQFTPQELAAVVEHAHAAGLPVVAHAHSLAGARHALAAGVDGIEHFTCLSEAGMAIPEDLLAEVAAHDVTVCFTGGSDQSRLPPLHLIPPAILELVHRFAGGGPEEIPALQVQQMQRARAHGLTVLSGTDAGVAPHKDHGNQWRAVLQLQEAGYTLEQALAAATTVAARACRVESVTGSLTRGLAADLLLVDGDLRADPSALGRPVETWIRGAPAGLIA